MFCRPGFCSTSHQRSSAFQGKLRQNGRGHKRGQNESGSLNVVTEDRWGDYDLLFGSAKLNLKYWTYQYIIRSAFTFYEDDKVFRNGLVMLKMCWYGFLNLKLGY